MNGTKKLGRSAPATANQVWAYDTTTTSQKLKCLTVVDEYTWESLAIDVAGSIRSVQVNEVLLPQLMSVRGVPRILRSDNGPEFVSNAMLRWTAGNGLDMVLIEPGKPWQNGVAKNFNGKFRDECLPMGWFRTRAEAKVVIESWQRHYNNIRPHSSLGNLSPTAFRLLGGKTAETESIIQQ